VWRLFTNFFFLGKFSINFGIRLLMMYVFQARYGVQLEKGPFDKRTADFLWMMLFGAFFLLVSIVCHSLFLVSLFGDINGLHAALSLEPGVPNRTDKHIWTCHVEGIIGSSTLHKLVALLGWGVQSNSGFRPNSTNTATGSVAFRGRSYRLNR
ncbi:hypothetical protein BHE74_00023270, partial [Ensete ventricosum]